MALRLGALRVGGALCVEESGSEEEEEGECGEGRDLPHLPYLLERVTGGRRIDRATISAARARNCRTAGHTIYCG